MLVSKLDTYVPIKKRLVRANDAPYMNDALRKSIMRRSRLKNKYTKDPTVENSRKYKKRRNYCVNLLKKYYRSIDIKIVSDNRNFWKNIKPFFSEKHKKLSKVILVEKYDIISKHKHIAEIFNNFFLESGTHDKTSAIMKRINIQKCKTF